MQTLQSHLGGGVDSAVRTRMATRIAQALALLYPVVAVTTVGGASYAYVLLLAAGLVGGWSWKGICPRIRRLLLGFFAVLAVMGLTLFFSEDVGEGVGRLERYARLASLGLVYPVLRRTGVPLHRALGTGAVLAVPMLAVVAWREVNRLGADRAVGAYHHIVFGDLSVLWTCIGVVFLITHLRGWVRLSGLVLLAGAGVYAAILSGARGSWLGLLAFPFVLGYIYRHELMASRRARWSATALLMIVSAAGVWQGQAVLNRVDEAAADLRAYAADPASETSWGIRLSLGRNALLLARDAPLFGTGLGSFPELMREMVTDGRSLNPFVVRYTTAHSIYLDALVSAGIVGLVTMIAGYLVLPGLVFGRAVSAAKTPGERFCAIAGVVTVFAFAIFGISETLWSRNPFVNTYVVCMAIFLVGIREERDREET